MNHLSRKVQLFFILLPYGFVSVETGSRQGDEHEHETGEKEAFGM